MSRKRNHYQTLGVNADVTPAEIKRAYRKLAKTQHPDAHAATGSDAHTAATEQMMHINEAYETLKDEARRAEYDRVLGLSNGRPAPIFTVSDEEQERQKYLRNVFHARRSAIVRVLGNYKKQLRDLSADPFDERLVEQFQIYLDKLEDTLRAASNAFSRQPPPRCLEPAVQMMRYSIAQAADGLEELRYYCLNFDYNHLTMAQSLFRIASDLSKDALSLTKGS